MKPPPRIAGCTSTTQKFVPLTPWVHGVEAEGLRASVEMRPVGSNFSGSLAFQIGVDKPRRLPDLFDIVHDDAGHGRDQA